jgi:hypothetical protein
MLTTSTTSLKYNPMGRQPKISKDLRPIYIECKGVLDLQQLRLLSFMKIRAFKKTNHLEVSCRIKCNKSLSKLLSNCLTSMKTKMDKTNNSLVLYFLETIKVDYYPNKANLVMHRYLFNPNQYYRIANR